jgi:hypothetical protein
MVAMSTAMAAAGSAVAAPATTLSSSAAFGSSAGVQQLSAVRSLTSFNGSRMVAVRASQSSHEVRTQLFAFTACRFCLLNGMAMSRTGLGRIIAESRTSPCM